MWLNLIDDDLLSNTEFVYNLSYGKDSMAGLHVTIDILGIPVSRVVHAEVWATDTIPADLPPMVGFKARADAYIKQRWGLTVEHICATRDEGERLTYEKLFYRIPKRKDPNRGGYTGWPYQQGPWCNSKLKVRVDPGLPNQVGTMVQRRPQAGGITAFLSAAPTEEIGAPNSKPNIFQKPPATRGKEKYRASTGHRRR